MSNGHGEGARLCGPASFTSGSRAVLVGMLREADEKPH